MQLPDSTLKDNPALVFAPQMGRFAPGDSASPRWVYLGWDAERRRKIRTLWPSGNEVFIGSQLDKVAQDIKEEFISWTGVMGGRQKNAVRWFASSLSANNALQSDFFPLICYDQLIGRWIRDGVRSYADIIYVEDPELFAAIRRRCDRRSDIRFFGFGRLQQWREKGVMWLRIPYAHSRHWLNGICLWLKARLIFTAADLRRQIEQSKNSIHIFSWVEDRCFNRSPAFTDPYTGRLEDVLKQNGRSVQRLTFHRLSIAHLRALRKCASAFLVSTRFLRLRDIFLSAGRFFFIDDLSAVGYFMEADYTPLIRREVLRENGNPDYLDLHLWYLTMCRIAATVSPLNGVLIYPFENQKWEKLMLLALKSSGTAVWKTVGYQHSSVGPLYLFYHIALTQRPYLPLPRRAGVLQSINVGRQCLPHSSASHRTPRRADSSTGALIRGYLFFSRARDFCLCRQASWNARANPFISFNA